MSCVVYLDNITQNASEDSVVYPSGIKEIEKPQAYKNGKVAARPSKVEGCTTQQWLGGCYEGCWKVI